MIMNVADEALACMATEAWPVELRRFQRGNAQQALCNDGRTDSCIEYSNGSALQAHTVLY